MEFSIPVDELQRVLGYLSNAVRINEDDITSMIEVSVADEVKFKASDGSVTLLYNCSKCEVTEGGRILFRLRDVKDYVFKFVPLMGDYGTENFTFVINDEESIIKTKTVYPNQRASYKKLKFSVFDSQDMPVLKVFEEPDLVINSDLLKKGLNKVIHCVNPDEVRRSLTGINIHIQSDRIVFAGTNGVKLTEFGLDINADIETNSYILRYNVSSVLRNVLDDDAQVFIKFDTDKIYAKSNEYYIAGSLLFNETYPDYRSMLELSNYITVPKLDLYDNVHTVIGVLDTEDNSRLSLTFKGNQMILSNDKAESKQEFDEVFDTELDVDINGVFLDSILNDFKADNIQIHFDPSVNYLVLKSAENEKHTALITLVKRR